jgi:hypothetical protein
LIILLDFHLVLEVVGKDGMKTAYLKLGEGNGRIKMAVCGWVRIIWVFP